MYICMFVCTCSCEFICRWVGTQMYLCVCMFLCVHGFECMFMCVCVCAHVCCARFRGLAFKVFLDHFSALSFETVSLVGPGTL